MTVKGYTFWTIPLTPWPDAWDTSGEVDNIPISETAFYGAPGAGDYRRRSSLTIRGRGYFHGMPGSVDRALMRPDEGRQGGQEPPCDTARIRCGSCRPTGGRHHAPGDAEDQREVHCCCAPSSATILARVQGCPGEETPGMDAPVRKAHRLPGGRRSTAQNRRCPDDSPGSFAPAANQSSWSARTA
jgi:hypothetical protein